jgi:hypothetical protein
MTGMRKQIIGVVLALAVLVVAWRWLFPPYPGEEDVIALYASHKQEFAAFPRMLEKHSWQLTPEEIALAGRIDPRMNVVLGGYDGTLRFILAERGLMTIGPERMIGLTFIPSDPARHGIVVPVLAPHEQEVGYVYLRQVDDHWYVFTQNTD